MANAMAPPALVVGTGFGCRVHVPALRAAGFAVAGLVGTNLERTARRAAANGISATFTDLDDAIDKTGAVAVTIATQAGGGWLGASGSHIIDQARTWAGEFESVSAALPTVSARQGAAEDSFVLRFRMRNGAEGVIQNTAAAWGPSAAMARIAGTKGTAWIDGSKAWIADRNGVRELTAGPDLELPPPPPPSDDPRRQFSHLELGPYTRLCETLRAAVEGRAASGPVPPPTFRDGLASMEVLDAIRASDARGGALVAVGRALA